MIMMSKLSVCLSALNLLVFVCSVYASPIGLKKRQEISELDEFTPASLLDTPLPASADIGDFDFGDEESNLNADAVLPELEAESVETEPETEQLEGFTEDEVADDSVEKLAEEFDMLEGNGEVENIEAGDDLVGSPAEVSDDAEPARTPDELPEETPIAVPSETQEEDEGFRFTAMPADFPATPTPVSDVEEYDAPLPTEEPVPVPADEDYLESDDADTEKGEEEAEVDENDSDDDDETSEDDKVEENDDSNDGSEAENVEETEDDTNDDENTEKDDDTEDSDVTAVGSGDSGSLTAQDDVETTSDQDLQTKPGVSPANWVWFVVAFAVVGLAAAFFAYGKPRRLVRYVQRLGETPNYAELRGNNPDIEMREGSWVH